jgi:hypothetical protein
VKKRAPSGAPLLNRFPDFGRLSEPLAENPKLFYLRWLELVVALRQVIHRVVEPILLIFGRRAYYAAADNLLEQLVPGLLKGSRRSDRLLPESVFLSVHQFGWGKTSMKSCFINLLILDTIS